LAQNRIKFINYAIGLCQDRIFKVRIRIEVKLQLETLRILKSRPLDIVNELQSSFIWSLNLLQESIDKSDYTMINRTGRNIMCVYAPCIYTSAASTSWVFIAASQNSGTPFSALKKYYTLKFKIRHCIQILHVCFPKTTFTLKNIH
jgi:hypothetical protein